MESVHSWSKDKRSVFLTHIPSFPGLEALECNGKKSKEEWDYLYPTKLGRSMR